MTTSTNPALQEIAPFAPVCYFLGAGFSAATRYRFPTTVGFIDREFEYCGLDNNCNPAMRESSFEELPPKYGPLFDRIEAQYGPLAQVNIETVMTDLYIRAFGLGRSWGIVDPRDVNEPSAQDHRRDYELLIAYIGQRLLIKDRDSDQCDLSNRLVASLKSHDSIITLNYDTIIERHLVAQSKDGRLDSRINALSADVGPPWFGPAQSRPKLLQRERQTGKWPALLCKLHGSIDWVSCDNDACPNHGYVIPTSKWYESNGLHGATRCNCCGWEGATVIIPPAIGKEFQRFPNLSLMWLRAYQALRYSWRWVFIGVSFAPTDFHLSALLRSASNAVFWKSEEKNWQICIVDKDENSARCAADRLKRSLSPKVAGIIAENPDALVCFSGVEEYLAEVGACDVYRKEH